MSSQKIVDLRNKRPGPSEGRGQGSLPLRPQRRVSPVRVRRRRTRVITGIIVLAAVLFCAFVASYASYLPRYSVETVSVQGAQAVSANAVADYAESLIYNGSRGFFSHANILLYPKALIAKDIPLEFPRIQSATVSSGALLANAVTITVVERQTFALWCDASNTCYDMDQSGYIFAQAPMSSASSSEYIFTGGISTSTPAIGQTFAPGHAQGLIVFLQQLSQAGYTPLGAEVQDDQDFTVPLQQGFSVYASFGEDAGTLVNNLQLVLSSDSLSGQAQNLEYVDLRFGDKVYYKLKGQSQASTTAQ